MACIVYQITHRKSKRFYIGKTLTRYWNRGYMGGGLAIQAAVKKYGKDAFYRGILAEFKTEEEAFAFETECIDVNDPLTYNLKEGGLGGMQGYQFTPEVRAKIGDAHRGKVVSQETKDAISATTKGKPHTQAHNDAVGAALKGRVFSPETLRRMSEGQKKRLPPTEETRAKMRDAAVGRTISPEHKAALIKANIGRPVSQKTRELLRSIMLRRSAEKKAKLHGG